MDAEMKKWKTMEFMTGLMNHLSWIGAREEMRKFTQSKKGILEYVGDSSKSTQMILEYVYVFNRLGTLLSEDMLDIDILFKTWQPEKFFVDLWEKLLPLVKKEREDRKIPDLYGYADQLVKRAKKYAKKNPRGTT